MHVEYLLQVILKIQRNLALLGDSYMAVAGAPTQCDDHALRCTRAALGIIKYIKNRNNNATFKWSLRVGLHSGPVVAGVIGNKRITYDIWGDSVNLASRMESASEPNRVNISAYTFDLIRDQFKCEYRGKIPVKGKGEIDMYFRQEFLGQTAVFEVPDKMPNNNATYPAHPI